MRFFDDGPDIPDALVDARASGDVVFFCGAGLSAPAGLPDFDGLARRLLDTLAAQESRIAHDAGESLDRVFTALVKEFGGIAVDRELAAALRTPRGADLRHHRAVIDLSRGLDGAAKIVTTNFDRLFERADPSLRRYVPPTLPDLAQWQPIDGVVYLHGRLAHATAGRAGYVISSSDFGRAYLAEGWAARFVRDLRERYTIVLLGYSANDPPMRYLLEGLNSREGGERRPIYSFASDGAAAGDEAWRDKGVTAIPYGPRDAGHGGLWDSLFAWAATARDRDAWRDRLVALAQVPPDTLQAFERGQVVHLVGSDAGARAFAAATPPPPAEWLCVFDAHRRYARPGRPDWRDKAEVDPLDRFGLDSDPPRPAPRPGGAIEPPGIDAIRWRRGDASSPERQRLSGYHPEWTGALPPRLFHLARWFGRVMDQPAAIWWAAVSATPHPDLVREILHRLERGDTLPATARHFWRCYLEAVRSHRDDPQGHRFYRLAERISAEGWTNATLRELERVVTPFFEINRPPLVSPVPPKGDWDSLPLRSLAEIGVATIAWPDDRLTPPDTVLAKVVAILRGSLIRMAEMLDESTSMFWHAPTLHPTGDRGEMLGSGRKNGHFLRFRTLFDALVAKDAAAARDEAATWNSDDPTVFAKLFLYAATLPDVIAADTVAARILAMPDQVFWDSYLAREMLFALRANWSAFPRLLRRRIERRVIAGPPPYDEETGQEHAVRRQARAASWLRWLELHGRTLSAPALARLPALKSADPRWSDAWAWSADDSLGPRGGVIHRNTDPQGLDKAPLASLVALAEGLSTDDRRQLRDDRPFDGVVATAPMTALFALRLAARRGERPERFWRSLLSNWPDGTSPRLQRLLAHSLARLPDDLFAALRFETGSWMRTFAGGLIRHDRRSGLAAFDAVTARFLAAAPEVLKTSLGTMSVGGVPKVTSDYSANKAINGPGGDLAMVLLGLMQTPRRGRSMPGYIGIRLIRLLDLPGDGAGHAACLIARQFRWLDHWYGGWTQQLMPFFAVEHPLSEAMWHGLAADDNGLTDHIGALIKPSLLRILTFDAPWRLDEDAHRRMIQNLVNLTYPGKGKAVVSHAEARRVLMMAGDEARAGAIRMLANSMPHEGMWPKFIRPFIIDAWPRQLKFQNETSARAFASLIDEAGDRFPEVLALVLPFLRPIPHLDAFAYRLHQCDTEGEGYSARFPADTLRVLNAIVGDERQTAPWSLDEILDTIANSVPALRQSDSWRRLHGLTR